MSSKQHSVEGKSPMSEYAMHISQQSSNPHTQAILSAISSSNVALLDSLFAKTQSDPETYPSPAREQMIGIAAYDNQPLALSHLLQLPPVSRDDVTPQLLSACAEHIECYRALVTVHPHALAYELGHTGDAFGFAVLRGDCEFMRVAANEPAWKIDPNVCQVYHESVLLWATGCDERVLRCLLTECGEVRVRGTDAIRSVIKKRRMDNLRCLLEHAQEGTKAVVDGWPLPQDPYPWQPEQRKEQGWDVPNLHYAAALGNVDAMRILLEAGADPDLEDGSGRKADISAVRWKGEIPNVTDGDVESRVCKCTIM
ncbi:hypothetical protein B0H11DRAFT_330538 [Mycena galericulata]|nr:hypothetical protein B0H11DRAFT_564810 [Mycena galericulata]KAJ7506166.1 hypothetical protein B0H11DRAFT_330538 [Mycena galericulata]